MTCNVSHWSGRLGNNIQQVANCIMRAELTGDTCSQTHEHSIIKKFDLNFGDKPKEEVYSGRFYAWEPLVHCEKGIFEGGNEIGVDVNYVYANMRRICRNYVTHELEIPKHEPICDDLNLIESFDKCILITESDRDNPIVSELEKIDKVKIQSSSVQEDFATLMAAKNVALSGVGTFAMAAALCSKNIKHLYSTDLLLTEHLNYSMLVGTDVQVHTMELKDYLTVFPCSWMNTEEQRQFILNYNR